MTRQKNSIIPNNKKTVKFTIFLLKFFFKLKFFKKCYKRIHVCENERKYIHIQIKKLNKVILHSTLENL
jgi:hypothetical protein